MQKFIPPQQKISIPQPGGLIFALCLILATTGCAQSSQWPVKKFSKEGQFFGSSIKIDVCTTEPQTAALEASIESIWTRFADIHWRLSVYDPKSDLNRLNASLEPITIGADTYGLIQDSLYYHKISDGMFDISIYPLIKLWKSAEKENRLPTDTEIQKARTSMGADQIRLLTRNQIQRLNPAVEFTIDSIADGYAADEAARILRAYGFSNFLIDASGELYGGGMNCGGTPWRIGVQDPQKHNGLIDVLKIKNAAVTTSGNYEHFYNINGRQYSHILNPKTGFPRDEILSATVIAPNAQFSDFWSTVLCLLDPDQATKTIDGLGDQYASMIIFKDNNGQIVKKQSRYYPKYRIPSP